MPTPWQVAAVQAAVTGHMVLHTQAPIAKKLRVRGVLPSPGGAPAVRIAVGARKANVRDLQAVYELPLLRKKKTLTPWQAVGLVRQEAGAVRLYSNAQVSTVLGTPLIRLTGKPSTKDRLEDRAHTLLTTLTHPTPAPEDLEQEPTLLVGFLYLPKGRMRLYVRHQDAPDAAIGCDVRLAEAGPAVTAEVLCRSQEHELHRPPGNDPHCTAVVNLTH